MDDKVYGHYWCSIHKVRVIPGHRCVMCECEEITKDAEELKKKHPELFKNKLKREGE